MQGKFITFEGIDGAGKSSHIAGVCDFRPQKKGTYGRFKAELIAA